NARAVCIHHVHVRHAVTLAHEGDQPAVRRPRGLDREKETTRARGIPASLGHAVLVPAVRGDAVDRVVAVAGGDEQEVRPRCSARAAPGESERHEDEQDEPAHAACYLCSTGSTPRYRRWSSGFAASSCAVVSAAISPAI